MCLIETNVTDRSLNAYLIDGGTVCSDVGISGIGNLARRWINTEQTWRDIIANDTVCYLVKWRLK